MLREMLLTSFSDTFAKEAQSTTFRKRDSILSLSWLDMAHGVRRQKSIGASRVRALKIA